MYLIYFKIQKLKEKNFLTSIDKPCETVARKAYFTSSSPYSKFSACHLAPTTIVPILSSNK